ncbi:cardiac-enriched FHL2-interacting protein [Scyliorhinus canicula]|uniref:cardiac-enriched FHL2-interacting protein n=1 Tax=Scyliorhinus canicula TaxID=7830 RepID=UPI0018F362AE|nr:cardiac-enriched FHL2-interacting protein [Scyliorhinus canicula]XP_038638980.1 cardiac-enriched FHL2-interacting protein [Scyliorhinus canicula]XP_038638981.1 cardiac-enriched FHL2-interacting protein [Scyliorhinus canicula]XP_038638982.1 cardiac-enriched FHL2-interacting protein [Scyliorhinus canicula]XP_038638983.1 cardiac-enriched FHL2-interacting protein [Scyliorhinus canicula]
MNSLEFAKKPRIMQGCSKHVDGFSDTSSAGSILDEADREVSRLTERAFKSLCVAQEGMCNDLGMTSSPSAASGNQASELPGSDRSKRSTGQVKISSNIIQKQPKEAPETFQKLIVQCSVEDEDSKGRTGNGFPRETLGSSQKLGKQKSKISSLIEAFDQSDGGVTGELVLSAKQVGSGHSGLPEESEVHNITQWDSSALVNMHKEKSSFSAACQEHYWLNCKKRLPPARSSKTSVLSSPKSTQYRKQGRPTDATVLKHPAQTSEDSPSRKAGQLRTPDSKGNFLHSESSAFKSWHDHSRFLFEEGDHVEKLSLSLQPSVQARNLCDDGARCRRAHPLVQARVPPNEAKTDLTQKPVNCSPSGRDSDTRSFVPEANQSGVKESAGQGNSLQDIKPEKDRGGGTIENEDEGRGFQLWRSSRNPQFKKQIDSEVVSGEVVPAECHLAEVSTLAEQRARGESPSFSISKLLTPNIGHSANGAEVSPAQPMAVTPPLIQLPVVQGDEGRGGGDYKLRESYKSKASSLLYNLKDVRKRVKSTYTSSVTPQSLSEQSKNKEYIFQNIHQTNERTSSAPLRLGTRENYTGDSCDQEKPNKVPNAVSATPTARSLSKAETIHRAEPDTWKNDDYLNVRSPQTVKEAGSYPSWRTRNARPRSAMVAAEVHVERGLDRKVACQLNKLSSEGGATNQKRSALARNSPEDAKAVLEKTEERRNRSHRSRKSECPLFSQVHKAGYPNENHFRMQDGLASQRPEETYRPMLEANVPSNGASSHPATQDLKLSNHSYFTLGGDHCQDTERVMADHSTERSTGGTRSSLSGCPTAEVLKDIEKYELQYYALSDPAANSEGMDEHQSRTPRDLTGRRAKGDSPLDMLGEEKFYSIFSKQEIHGQGNITNSPRPTLFKIKDNMLKISPVMKSAKSTIPKPAPGGVDVDLRKETPDMSVSEGTPGCDKLDSEEMGAGRSVAMNPRPDSTCSVDSKTAGKPPVVPPKSEKALRRAKKLATRKKRTDGKQKKQGGDETESDPVLSNTPEPPPCVPASQTPIACSPVPMLPMDSCVIPAVPNIMALNSTRPLTSVHSFPLSQRKLLQDPESGQYFFVDIPIQVQTKTLYDPETDKYFQVSIPSTGRNASLDFFNNSYVLYPGFLSFPLTSVSVLRPHSHMSAPAILLDVQEKEAPLNEWTNTDLTCTGEQGNEPYIETLFDPQNDTQCSAVSSQLQTEGHNLELIVMEDLEDIASENN